MPVIIRRAGYRVAARLMGVYYRLRRPTVHGVRCVIEHRGRVLLVRHTYGDRRWALPGGLIRRGEPAETTARREMEEELGFEIGVWRALGALEFTGQERATHVVDCFAAVAPRDEPALNAAEISQARWYAPAELPADAMEWTDVIVARATAD